MILFICKKNKDSNKVALISYPYKNSNEFFIPIIKRKRNLGETIGYYVKSS